VAGISKPTTTTLAKSAPVIRRRVVLTLPPVSRPLTQFRRRAANPSHKSDANPISQQFMPNRHPINASRVNA
jgi:hypothetical protein